MAVIGDINLDIPFLGEVDLEETLEGEVGLVELVPDQDRETYTGEYTVTPDFDPIVLPCAEKIMADDVTVKKIPVWEVDNTAGGVTVIIGGEFAHEPV